MLIATSVIYLLLFSCVSINLVLYWWLQSVHISYDAFVVGLKSIYVLDGLIKLIFAYNFYVYLITGKQFRSELHRLFCCCLSSSSSSSSCCSSSSVPPVAAAVVVVVDRGLVD